MKMRPTGETQFMIDSLVDAVKEGSPTNVVFAHSLSFIKGHLLPRIIEALEDKDMKVEEVSRSRIICEGSVIMFMSVCEHIHKIRGLKGSHFVDHHCADKYFEIFMDEPI
jgi:hypothetical protein